MAKKPAATLRAVPQQARAQQRMNEIIEAAAALFAEVGYETATTNEIARRANTSIGSLYRFFPDKFAIFQALSARYFQEVAAIGFSMSGILEEPISVIVDHVIDEFEKFRVREPAFEAVFVFADASPELKNTDRQIKKMVAALIAEVFTKRKMRIDEDRMHLVAMMCIESINLYMRLSLTQAKSMRPVLKEECKRLITSYLQSFES